jgi:hypothetical protein
MLSECQCFEFGDLTTSVGLIYILQRKTQIFCNTFAVRCVLVSKELTTLSTTNLILMTQNTLKECVKSEILQRLIDVTFLLVNQDTIWFVSHGKVAEIVHVHWRYVLIAAYSSSACENGEQILALVWFFKKWPNPCYILMFPPRRCSIVGSELLEVPFSLAS